VSAKKHLLVVNVFDKHEWVEAWAKQFEKLDQDKWRLQVVCNGPNPKEGWIIAENGTPTEGYKRTLRATQVADDVDVVVSVHAKTALNDITHLDWLVDTLIEDKTADAIFTERELYNYPLRAPDGTVRIALGLPVGEYLFLFAVKAERWDELTSKFANADDLNTVGTEKALAKCVDDMELMTLRLPCFGPNISCINGERALFGIGNRLNIYGCEQPGPDMMPFQFWAYFGLTPFYHGVRRGDLLEWFRK
jgi:hypothetical protein